MRRAQNADTHALKQPRLSQNISPVCSNFVLVMLLESESEKGAENVDFRTAKNIQIQPKPDGLWIHTDSFSLFLDQFLETDL